MSTPHANPCAHANPAHPPSHTTAFSRAHPPSHTTAATTAPSSVHIPTLAPAQPLWQGTIFLQQTDATGKTKNAEFLSADYIKAIEKAGPITVIKMQGQDGQIVSKKKSAIARMLVTDRGGGCVRALEMVEAAMVILTDTCKGHGADLLVEDWAIPFKPHLKKVARNHTAITKQSHRNQ
jgi:hypothetical protein